MRDFKAALEQGAPDAAYLFHGDDDFLKEAKLRQLIDHVAEPATRDFNVEILRAQDTDAARLNTALEALPVMATRRIVVLRDIGGLKKDARAALDAYLVRPASDVVFVMIAPAGWKTDAALVARASALEFRALTEEQAAKWVVAHATELGIVVDPDAAALLVQATGVDLAMIDGEIRKLRDFGGSAAITTAAVREIVGIRAGETSSDLLDRVCARDGVGAAALVPTVLSQPKTTGVSLVMALTTHMLALGHLIAARQAGMSTGQFSSELYTLFGEQRSAVVGRPWGEAIGTLARSTDQWDRRAVDRALSLLRDADSGLKDTSVSEEEQVVATLVMAMCARPRSRAA